ncbi:MAG TPA: hypothetical protein VMJ93_13240 [Verrucomicrobiae bacterium]|nr:hypothetical protein [Verrucomicrobiae bacterium]
MKKCLFAAVVLAFCLPQAGLSQSASDSGVANGKGSDPQAGHRKVVNLSGKVSADAKWLVTAHKANLQVVNPELLSAYEGRIVLVKCERDPVTNAIRVVAIRSVERTPTGQARLDDAAFRR